MKLKILFYTFFIVLFLLLQTTLLRYVAICGVMPNVLIVFVIVTALIRGNIEGGVVGFLAGFAVDMMFGSVLGFYALLGLYLGLAAGSMNRRLYRDNLLVAVFFTFVYSVLYETVVHILNTIMSEQIHLLYPLTRVIFPEAIYNCVVAVFMYSLLIKVDRRFIETGKLTRKY